MFNYGETLSDSKAVYIVLDLTENNDDDVCCSGLYINGSSADELKDASEINYSGEYKTAADANEAAKIGASILDKYYDKWTETNTVIVTRNKKGDAWVVTGQLLSRESTMSIGVVVFSASTGEVFYIGKGVPAD